MLWIKRNLFLAVSGGIALILVVYGGYYLFSGRSLNATVEADLESKQRELDNLYRQRPFPAQSNIVTAQAELLKVTNAIQEARQFFQPVPFEPVTDLEFKSQLDQTIFELVQKAKSSGIELPAEDYAFSFDAQKKKFRLDPASFPAINQQLAEVRTICNILFDAKIHSLTSLKRVRLTPDDPVDSPDYRGDWQFETNKVTGAVITPYEVSFTCFSADLASVMEGFMKSPYGLIVRAIDVGNVPPPPKQAGNLSGLTPNQLRRFQRATVPQAPVNEVKTVLNEERFRVTLWIAVVKPATPNS